MPEQWYFEDGKLVQHVVKEIDLDRANLLKQAPKQPVSDSWHVGTVPLIVLKEWAKEAGVKWDDPAFKDVIRRKLLDGDFSKFRVKEGRF